MPPIKNKTEKYERLLPQIEALFQDESDLIANLANTCALLKETFQFWWVGFYLVKLNSKQNEELVLGPFQGPLACTRIAFGKGVCGTSWKNIETIIVPDVHQFPGHIACSAQSQSEIVIPLVRDGKVWGVLDVDSEYLDHFDEIDSNALEAIVALIK